MLCYVLLSCNHPLVLQLQLKMEVQRSHHQQQITLLEERIRTLERQRDDDKEDCARRCATLVQQQQRKEQRGGGGERRSPRQRHKPGAEADSGCSIGIASRDLGAVTLTKIFKQAHINMYRKRAPAFGSNTRAQGSLIGQLSRHLSRSHAFTASAQIQSAPQLLYAALPYPSQAAGYAGRLSASGRLQRLP